jgi:hypothetical protein
VVIVNTSWLALTCSLPHCNQPGSFGDRVTPFQRTLADLRIVGYEREGLDTGWVKDSRWGLYQPSMNAKTAGLPVTGCIRYCFRAIKTGRRVRQDRMPDRCIGIDDPQGAE